MTEQERFTEMVRICHAYKNEPSDPVTIYVKNYLNQFMRDKWGTGILKTINRKTLMN